MPIYNYAKLLRFSKMCHAEIPVWLDKRMQAYGDDQASIRALGIEIVTKLCQDLLEHGAPGLHIYTLNQLEPTRTILENLGIHGGTAIDQQSLLFREANLRAV